MTETAHDKPFFAPLGKHHARAAFACSKHPVLARYVQERAMQDLKGNAAAPYALVDTDGTTIIGYYTLSGASVTLDQIPPAVGKRIPRYPQIGAIRIGRLAVDDRFLRRRYGETLLMDALARIGDLASSAGFAFVVVDAKDDEASAFYQRYGFEPFPDTPLSLYLPMQTVFTLVGRR